MQLTEKNKRPFSIIYLSINLAGSAFLILPIVKMTVPAFKSLVAEKTKNNFELSCINDLINLYIGNTIPLILIASILLGLAWGLFRGRSWAWLNGIAIWSAANCHVLFMYGFNKVGMVVSGILGYAFFLNKKGMLFSNINIFEIKTIQKILLLIVFYSILGQALKINANYLESKVQNIEKCRLK